MTQQSLFLPPTIASACTWPAWPADSICGRTLDAGALPVPRVTVTLYSRDSNFQTTIQSDYVCQYCNGQIPPGDDCLQAIAPSLGMTSPKCLHITSDLR